MCGLPNDNLSVENGIIIATARRDETVGIIHGAWSVPQPRQGDGHWWLTHKDRQLWAAGGVWSHLCVDVWIRAILVEGKGFSVKLRPRNLRLKQFFSTGIQPLRHWSSNYGWRKANKYIKLYGKMASEQGMGAVLSPYERDELDSSDLETLQKETVDTVYFPCRVKQWMGCHFDMKSRSI